MTNDVTVTSDRTRGKMLSLWFICCFGLLPIYYWYAGRKPGTLRFITLNFFFLGALIDLIKILTGSFRDYTGALLRQW